MPENSLKQLLDARPDLWLGPRRPGARVLATGLDWLDARLPDGGWPKGRLVELLPALPGAGELELLLPALAACTRDGLPVVFAAPPLVPCPQALAGAGLDLGRVLVLRRPGQALWATEQCLKSGLCGAVAVWPPPGPVTTRAVRRLQLAAESGPAPVFVCYRPGQQPPASLATLRLAVHPGPGTAPEVEILRARGVGTGSAASAAAPLLDRADRADRAGHAGRRDDNVVRLDARGQRR